MISIPEPEFKFLSILAELFNGQVQYSGTKQQPLINAGTVCCSDELHQYLYSLHPSLTVVAWMNGQRAIDKKKHQRKTPEITRRIQTQISLIIAEKISQQESNKQIKMEHENWKNTFNAFTNNVNIKQEKEVKREKKVKDEPICTAIDCNHNIRSAINVFPYLITNAPQSMMNNMNNGNNINYRNNNNYNNYSPFNLEPGFNGYIGSHGTSQSVAGICLSLFIKS